MLFDLKKSVRYLLLCIKRTPPTNYHFKTQDRVLYVPKNGMYFWGFLSYCINGHDGFQEFNMLAHLH